MITLVIGNNANSRQLKIQQGYAMPKMVKSNYGLTISQSLICERPLDVISSLCWSSEDLGLTRIHQVGEKMFLGRREAELAAEVQGIPKSRIPSYFTWVSSLDGKHGGAREKWLRERYWPGREQTVNHMLNTAIQAYPQAIAAVAASLCDLSMNAPEWVETMTESPTRKFIGMPDTMVIDYSSQAILLMEIKTGSTTTKYTLDQHLKYIGLTALLTSPAFFPGFRVHTLLVGAKPALAQNIQGLSQVLTNNGPGRPVFATGGQGQPASAGASIVSEKIAAHLSALEKLCPMANINKRVDFRLYFADWKDFHDACPPGLFRDNVAFLLPHLLGKHA